MAAEPARLPLSRFKVLDLTLARAGPDFQNLHRNKPTADGFLNLSATGNKNFAKFCKLIDQEKMIADPRFASSGLRSRNREALRDHRLRLQPALRHA